MKKKFKLLGVALAACSVFAMAAMASGCSAKESTDKWFEQIFCKHKYDEGVETQAATCTDVGILTYTCTECGKTKNEDIPTIEHIEAAIPAVSPTCIEVGYSDGVWCEVCEYVIVEQTELAALGHLEVVDEAVAATCTTVGWTAGSHCARCNEVIVAQEKISATGHSIVTIEGKAATCTETGMTDGQACENCGTVYVAQETVAALGHIEVVDEAVAATCTTAGKTEGKHCARCDEVLVAQETVAALGHTEVTSGSVSPTCCLVGSTGVVSCSVCNIVLVEDQSISMLPHTEVVDAAVAATCTTTGLTEGKHCSECLTVIVAQAVIEKTEHIDENSDDICDVCGYDFSEILIEPYTNLGGYGYFRIYRTESDFVVSIDCCFFGDSLSFEIGFSVYAKGTEVTATDILNSISVYNWSNYSNISQTALTFYVYDDYIEFSYQEGELTAYNSDTKENVTAVTSPENAGTMGSGPIYRIKQLTKDL